MARQPEPTLIEFVRYNQWANQQLLAICLQLDESLLTVDIQGTAGSIRQTFEHLLRAEAGFLKRIHGKSPPRHAAVHRPAAQQGAPALQSRQDHPGQPEQYPALEGTAQPGGDRHHPAGSGTDFLTFLHRRRLVGQPTGGPGPGRFTLWKPFPQRLPASGPGERGRRCRLRKI